MKSIEDKETAGLKFCHACNVEVWNMTDRFCRHCGERQIYDTDRLYDYPPDSSITPHMDPISETVAHPLPQNATVDVTSGKLRRRLFNMLGVEY